MVNKGLDRLGPFEIQVGGFSEAKIGTANRNYDTNFTFNVGPSSLMTSTVCPFWI